MGHDGEESLESATAPGPEERRRRSSRKILAITAAVILVAAIVASLVSIPYYAITPGVAQPVGRLIGLPKQQSHHHKGKVLLVDVELTPLRAIEWPYFALDSNAQIVGSSALLGPETASQYNTEGVLDMADAQQAATVVALHRLGYEVTARPRGALMYAFLPGSPAERYLAVGEIVTAVGRTPTRTAQALSLALSRYKPGQRVEMKVLSYPARKSEEVKVRLSAWRIKGKGKKATLVCPLFGTKSEYPIFHESPATGKKVASAPCIGSYGAETSYSVGKLPFSVNLANEGIIGPSAGLAFTLGLMERLDPDDLTGGHVVAATGTMSVTGAVGDVGGVAQKTIAVRQSGAKIFFVPRQEYKVAKAHAGPSLKIYPVSSIGQVLKILKTYGGKLAPAAPGA